MVGFVDDDGTVMEELAADPMAQVHIDAMEKVHIRQARDADARHARDLEEAGRVADMVIVADPSEMASPEEVTDLLQKLVGVVESHSRTLLTLMETVEKLRQHVAVIEFALEGDGEFDDAEPPVDTPDIATLDRPLTPAEDRARAAEIARIAKLDAAETEAADLRGIDQAAPDAPLPPPVEDEVVIPVVGPKGSFR